VLTAAQVNTYLQEQTVMVFASSTARTTALSGVLAEGMVSYLQDTNAVEVYNGSAWVGVSGAGDVTEVQAGTGISVASGTGPIPVVTNTMATAIDAKGDLVVGTGADTFARLAVGGTNGHTLQVDSSTATGLKWAAAAGGGGLTSMTLLNAGGTTLTGAATITVSFSAQQALHIIVSNASSANASSTIYFRLNGDTGSDYQYYGVELSAAAIARDQFTTTNIPLAVLSNNAASQVSAGIQLLGTNAAGIIPVTSIGMASAGGGTGQKGFSLFSIYDAAAAITSFSLVSDSGNFDNGTLFVYGMAV